ncbi:MAG TPA: MqnA/MqnD/SBP family protein [Bacteroidota bacterium]|nr:MqnA/MqnD/SBP family protein [Bacteroidota bacterium]
MSSSTSYRIGALKEFYCAPLTHSLEKSPAVAGLFVDAPAVLVDKLMSREIDAAFVTPIDYARMSSDLQLLPSLGVASIIESRTVLLCVKPEIRELRTVALGTATATDVVLAKIILEEQFKSHVAFVPVSGTVADMLQKADAALVCGDAVFTNDWDGASIDLIEEWTELTGLPFVHTVCATLMNSEDAAGLETLLARARAEGIDALSACAAEIATGLGMPAERVEEQLELYQYELLPTHRESIDEFFRLAYFHGILQDVPEIHMGRDDVDEEEEDDASTDPGMN